MSAPLADPEVRRVALVRLRVGLGDLLCSVPAVDRLRRARPDLHLTMITWPEMAPVLERTGGIDELLPFPGAEGIPERPPDPSGWPAFATAARERRFDLALQVYGDRPAANRVTADLGARLVGGFAPTGWEPPEDSRHLHLRYPLHLHEAQRHLSLFEHLGLAAGARRGCASPCRPPTRRSTRARSSGTACGRAGTRSCTRGRPRRPGGGPSPGSRPSGTRSPPTGSPSW